MAVNISNLERETDMQIQEATEVLNKKNSNPCHDYIMNHVLKVKNNES